MLELWVEGYVGRKYSAEMIGKYIRFLEGVIDRNAADGDAGAVWGVIHARVCHAFHD